MNSVTLQPCINGSSLQNRIENLSLILRKLFLAEPIIKIGSLNLFSTEPMFRYRVILKFRGLAISYFAQNFKILRTNLKKIPLAVISFRVPTETSLTKIN